MPKQSSSTTPDRVATRVVAELERLIVTGELLPGQQIRQEAMAERLQVSRLPIREGLRQLAAEGLLTHVHNVGYTVARLNQAEFEQIYLMRAVLEREVLRSLPHFGDDTLAEVRALAETIERAAESDEYLEMRLQNHAFHFAIFEQSPLHLIVGELRRLWTLAMPYHAVYLYDARGRTRVIDEHQHMIAALAAGDNEKLIDLMDSHRRGGEAVNGAMLNGPRAM